MEPSPEKLRDFYESGYSIGGEQGLLYARWRALGARGKADHVLHLLPPLGQDVGLLEVGCGDGALLAELGARRPAWRRAGLEVAAAPAEIAAARDPEADIRRYDGERLPFRSNEFAAGVLSHVLEHVADPVALLRETARVCRWVVLEVPLEANLSTLRASRIRTAGEVGHLQRFSRRDVRALISTAGLRRHAELTDPLPRDVQRFFAIARSDRLVADAKWAVRTAGHRVSVPMASRLYTLHYAALCGR